MIEELLAARVMENNLLIEDVPERYLVGVKEILKNEGFETTEEF